MQEKQIALELQVALAFALTFER